MRAAHPPATAAEPPVVRRSGITVALVRTAAAQWPIHLLMLLLGISGCGWFVLAAITARSPQGTPPWVAQAMPGVGILHFSTALGLWGRRRWAWIAAFGYMAGGAASLVPRMAAAVPILPQSFLALVAIPALVLDHREFLNASAVRRPGAR